MCLACKLANNSSHRDASLCGSNTFFTNSYSSFTSFSLNSADSTNLSINSANSLGSAECGKKTEETNLS